MHAAQKEPSSLGLVLWGLHRTPCRRAARDEQRRPRTARPLFRTTETRPASHAPAQIFIDLHSHGPRKAWPQSLWSNHTDMGVGHEQESRKWNFKKSVLRKITLCKPDFCEPGTCNSEMLCYSSEVTVNRGSVRGWQGLLNQNTPGMGERSL